MDSAPPAHVLPSGFSRYCPVVDSKYAAVCITVCYAYTMWRAVLSFSAHKQSLYTV